MSEGKMTAKEWHELAAKSLAAENEKLIQKMLDTIKEEGKLVYQREQNGLRDRMAIAAMQGMLDYQSMHDKEYIADHAYEMADVMLKARE